MKNEIALCLMVKNEEEYLAECIESALSLVNSIYILDTGSTDKTVEIASRYTKNVYYKEFNNDFGGMRNYLLNYVNDEEWVLFLDADECFPLESVSSIKSLINNLEEDVGGIRFYRYNFYQRGGWYTDHIVKMFRNRNFKYDKTVSEKIEKSILENHYKIVEPDIILNHFGRSKPRDIREKNTYNYISLMKEECKKNPEDGLMHAYIGVNSMAIGDFSTALEEGKKGVEIDPGSIRAHYFYGNILRSVNKNREALQIFNRALCLETGKMEASLLNMVGVTYITIREFDKARSILKKALLKNEALIHIYINIGLTYFFEKKYDKALQYFELVSIRNPAFLRQTVISDFEYDPFAACSYETIHNYLGLQNYIDICKKKVEESVDYEKKSI